MNRTAGLIGLAVLVTTGAASAEGPDADQAASISSFMSRREPAIASCYDRELASNPGLQGKLTLRFTIGTDGRVVETGVVEDALRSEAVVTCIKGLTRYWYFPIKPASPVPVQQSWSFKPSTGPSDPPTPSLPALVETTRKLCDDGAASGAPAETSAKACQEAGLAYADGNHGPRDMAKAASYFRKACDRGIAEGCFNLGVIQLKGLGGPRDEAAATALFKKACAGGCSLGCTPPGSPDPGR